MQHQNAPKPPADPKLLARARAMRTGASLAEKKLWSALRAARLNDQKWRRQVVIAGYILDFFCHEVRLGIELDGESHDTSAAYDEGRRAALVREGIRVVRFTNENVLFDFEAVLRTVVLEYEETRAFRFGMRPLP